jgi:hypothetical protein
MSPPLVQCSPPPLARLLLAALLCATAACRGAPSEGGAEIGPGADDAGRAVGPAPRRPTRRYHLGRTRERCEVYSVDGDAISAPTQVTCPVDLQMGERIRLSGKACVRESPSDPERDVPVVCPGALIAAEQKDTAARDAGT